MVIVVEVTRLEIQIVDKFSRLTMNTVLTGYPFIAGHIDCEISNEAVSVNYCTVMTERLHLLIVGEPHGGEEV